MIIANFNKATILIFSSPLPLSDDLNAEFLSLRTCQVICLPVCVCRYTLFVELSLPDANYFSVFSKSCAETLFMITSY